MLETLQKNESFTYKKLSPEEMESKGILGRLIGPCADFISPTRNGRKYGESLWDNVFNDDIVIEKIKNKCCFGELGHPADREEVCPEKIAIALNEIPKKNSDGQLIACFDILNTPCGKILKALCDYGTTIGISSRGSGDIMANDEVDPDTYCFECFDAVLVPAVKSARLQYVTESADKQTIKLKAALKEAYDTASSEDKKVIKETLDDLQLSVELKEDTKFNPELVHLPDDFDEDQKEPLLVESQEDEEHIEDEAKDVEEKDENKEEEDDTEIKGVEELENKEDVEKTEAYTVKDLVKELKDYDDNLDVEFKPIEIDGVEYPVEMLGFDDSEDGKLVVSIGYSQEIGDNINNEQPEEEIPEDEDIKADSNDEEVEEVEEKSEIVIDDEIEEALNNLKDVIRQNSLLENEIKSLKADKTVSDAEVASLQEELNKYKTGFVRMSELAAKSTKFEKEVQSLTEQLTQKDKEIKDLQDKSNDNTALTESVNAHEKKVKSLTEKLSAMQKDLTANENKLNEQRIQYKNKLTEAVVVAKDYKNKYDTVINKYIESRASMLGVKPATIISMLNENYSIDDVDNACEELFESNMRLNSLPFSLGNAPKVRISESRQARPQEDDGFEDLLKLAGLK